MEGAGRVKGGAAAERSEGTLDAREHSELLAPWGMVVVQFSRAKPGLMHSNALCGLVQRSHRKEEENCGVQLRIIRALEGPR